MKNGYSLVEKSAASDEAATMLDSAEQAFGFVPNMFMAYTDAPLIGRTILTLYSIAPDTGFSPTEQHVVFQAANVVNLCHYCVPAHSTTARRGGIPVEIDEDLRNDRTLNDPKLESLRQFTIIMTERRGQITPEEFNAFIDAGWTRQAALEVALLVTIKTLTNYTNHLTDAPIDEVFRPLEWTPATAC